MEASRSTGPQSSCSAEAAKVTIPRPASQRSSRNLAVTPPAEDYLKVARATIETADYSRGAEDGFRVLLESVGLLVGTGSYRYLTAGPDLLAALVGALSAQMPMPSRDFFAAVRREWGLVINQESAVDTVSCGSTGRRRSRT